ncbi:MAG TPA: hypothetical protein VKY85_05740 [Candidatus Angelobacter sp.]|nr:hypothetical protein [Candidatus Angelobacter sp.]
MRGSFPGTSLLIFIFASCLAYSQSWNQVPLTPPVFEYSGSGEGVQWPNSSSTAYPLNMYYPTGVSPSWTPDAFGCQWRQSLSPTTGSIGSAPNAYPPEYPEWAAGSSFTTSSQLKGAITRGGITQVGVGYQAPWGSTAIKGISMLASFPGGAEPPGSPTMSFFWESDNCADGDTEYGFVLLPEGGSQITQFYYTYWSNCVDSPDTCWAIGYAPSVGFLVVDQVLQCGGAVNMPQQVPISPNASYYYRAYPFPNGSHWDFMAQVADSSGNVIESCTVDPTNGGNTSCSPWPASGVVTNGNSRGSSCFINPATSTSEVNTTTIFNPQWTYGVGGWVFGVLTVDPAIGSPTGSPFVNGGAPVTINSMQVLE